MIASVAPLCVWLLLVFTAGLRRDHERGRQDALTFIYLTTFVALGIGLQYVVIYLRHLTAAGTIVVVEHYFIDLIAAVPYVLFIRWLTESAIFGRRLATVPLGQTQSLPLESWIVRHARR